MSKKRKAPSAIKRQAKKINTKLRKHWGAGWDDLGYAVKFALYADEILQAINAQESDTFGPAQEMIHGLFQESDL